MMTRVMTFAAIVVSLGAVVLAVRPFVVSRFIWGRVFLGVLGIFTPFRSAEFSPALILTLDLATLALIAISPVILKQSKTPVISRNSTGSGMSR